MKQEYAVVEFADADSFRRWVDAHFADTDGIWLRIYKKASGVAGVSYAEALDVALCYGWIDGQKKSYDELSFLQKFTPRRARSMWSKQNIEHVDRLTKAGLMQPAGLAEVSRAQADGRWDAAYDRQRDMQIPDDFLQALQCNLPALAFFETLNKSNRFAIAWRLQTAKTDTTRRRRMEKMIAMLADGRAFH